MGQETNCKAEWGSQVSDGKALLEGDHVLFRGGFRVKAMLKDVTSVRASDGLLTLATAEGPLVLHLGPQAEKWAHKILHPPSRADKLGLKPGLSVQVIGRFDADFVAEVPSPSKPAPSKKGPYDLVFLAAGERSDLGGIAKASASITPSGGVWIVYPKGVKSITEMDVLGAGRAAGLKDVKVASFSATHTALKFVIPKDRRV